MNCFIPLEELSIKPMNMTLLVLLTAAILEAGGDALVRKGLGAPTSVTRGIFFAFGALVLFAYGYVVNAPSWDFGRLLGVYVVFFFVVAQLITWIVFHKPPSTTVLIGGGFILAGGAIISYGG
jgi:drug/metabolite transporter superfamily protein YnfA